MSKFKIKNRQKRRYSKKNSPDASFYASVPLLVGFVPAMIIALAFIIAPLITINQVNIPLPHMHITVLPLASAITTQSNHAFHFLLTMIVSISIPHIPQVSINLPKVPVINLNFASITPFIIKLLTTGQIALVNVMQTVFAAFISSIYKVNPFPILAMFMTAITTGFFWLLNAYIGFTAMQWSIKLLFLTSIVNGLGNLFVFLWNASMLKITLFETLVNAICTNISNLFGALEIFITNLVAVIGATLVNFESFLATMFQQIFLVTSTMLQSLVQTISTAIVIAAITIFTAFLSFFTFIVHIVEWPFILLGKLLARLAPYFILIERVFARAWNELNNNFASTVALFAYLMKPFSK
jgi:hypothetical protein